VSSSEGGCFEPLIPHRTHGNPGPILHVFLLRNPTFRENQTNAGGAQVLSKVPILLERVRKEDLDREILRDDGNTIGSGVLSALNSLPALKG